MLTKWMLEGFDRTEDGDHTVWAGLHGSTDGACCGSKEPSTPWSVKELPYQAPKVQRGNSSKDKNKREGKAADGRRWVLGMQVAGF